MRDRRTSALIVVLAASVAACGGRAGPPAPVSQHGQSRPALSRAEAASGTIVVQQGETLYAISRRTGVALRALIDGNGLHAPYRLRTGQRLSLPGRAVAASIPPAPEVASGPAAPPVVATAPAPQSSVVSAPIAPPPATVPPAASTVPGGTSAPLPAPPAPVPPPAPSATAEPAPRPQTPPSQPVEDPPVAARPPAAGAAAPVETPAPARAGANFLWPLRGTIVSSFGTKTGGLQNDGINIAGARGTPVRAAENGVVVYAGNELKGFGNLLLLRHADGWMSAYAHLDEIAVERGQTIRRGQTIGKLGQTGAVTSPQLHFELRRGGKAVDPRGHLGPLQTAQAE